MKKKIYPFIVPLGIAFFGLLLNILACNRIFPKYLIVDFPLLITAYFAFFDNSEVSILPVIILATFRDIMSGGNMGSFFFATLSFFFFARYFYRKLYVENELFLLMAVFALLTLESISVLVINYATYDFVPHLLYPLTEMIRISINSLLAVPIFYALMRRTGPRAYEI
ncbi:MAG: hypothetical protein GTN70_07005 [Deltaproteobacteria bacterium]|nr:hypothetical protein [Deltaproteobacteria bacterium]NIS77444.1 hypothetical protein [Deltaproteobacteria bacterium]